MKDPDAIFAPTFRRRGRSSMGWVAAWVCAWVLPHVCRGSELRFPPPDFESGYQMPVTDYPAARGQWLEWMDVGVLIVALGWATWLAFGRRSRRGVTALSMFSLLYFGFYREGCICAIGSVQNVALALGSRDYALPVGVGVFFAAPLLVALFFGRTFCAAVCPHGALQDLVLVKPVTLPKWLESGLGILPFIYLGAGVTFAATGAAFVICRFDPFVPLFRLSGGMGMVLTGGVLLALGLFVGRPYCRFLCPYGALLKVASALSKWRIRVTPDVCTQCRLCPESCPFGVIQEPDSGLTRPRDLAVARRGLVWALAALPLVIAVSAGGGWLFGRVAAQWHPTVALAEDYARQLPPEAVAQLPNPDRLALGRAERQAKELLPRAMELRRQFRTAGLWFGIWTGLVIGIKLISIGMVRRRSEFLPDRTACFACARCFASCPQERIRLGWTPMPEAVGAHLPVHGSNPLPEGKPGGCGCGGGGR
ncbi:MAG: 4Fe-4S binding protein [Verrucomicrobiales bacterium]|nr:4Fe-4S binding protein [Verrucomicrobiales bacterium]